MYWLAEIAEAAVEEMHDSFSVCIGKSSMDPCAGIEDFNHDISLFNSWFKFGVLE